MAIRFNEKEKEQLEKIVNEEYFTHLLKRKEISAKYNISLATIDRIIHAKYTNTSWAKGQVPTNKKEYYLQDQKQEMLKHIIPNYEIKNYHSLKEFAKLYKVSEKTIHRWIEAYYVGLKNGTQENYGATSKYAVEKKGFTYVTEQKEEKKEEKKMTSIEQTVLDNYKILVKEIRKELGIDDKVDIITTIRSLKQTTPIINAEDNAYQMTCYNNYKNGVAQQTLDTKMGRYVSQKLSLENKIKQLQYIKNSGIDLSVLQQILNEGK